MSAELLPDRGHLRFACFFNWMLVKQDGGLTVSAQRIADRWQVSIFTARLWRRTYFKARGVVPMVSKNRGKAGWRV